MQFIPYLWNSCNIPSLIAQDEGFDEPETTDPCSAIPWSRETTGEGPVLPWTLPPPGDGRRSNDTDKCWESVDRALGVSGAEKKRA